MVLLLDWQQLLPLAASLLGAGFVSGLLAGLFGIGGGAVVVIALYEAFSAVGIDESVRMHLATGTALATLVPTTLRSFAAHRSLGKVDMELVRRLAPMIFVGAIAGAIIASHTSGNFLKWVWIVMGTILAVRMVFGRDDWQLGGDIPQSRLVELYGVFVGIVSALMSIGGGAFVSLLMTLYSRPLHQAVATSSAFGPMIAIPAMLGYAWAGFGNTHLPDASIGYISFLGVGLLVPMGLVAAPLGARLTHGLSKRKLELAFAGFIAIVVLRHMTSFMH